MATAAVKIFSQLPGDWSFQRTLSNAGTVNGHAYFYPLTTDTLHYKENGLFTAHNQKTYQVYQEYGYRFHEAQDKIATYFMRHGELDYLFHALHFGEAHHGDVLIATGSHACRNDMYYACYEFVHEARFFITYKVVGPNKNYISRTLFYRE